MPSCAEDWLKQAMRDLEQAEDSCRAGRHEWVCFAAQQAAEKAVKALHLKLGQEAWRHVVAKLLQGLPTTAEPAGFHVGEGARPLSIVARSKARMPAGMPVRSLSASVLNGLMAEPLMHRSVAGLVQWPSAVATWSGSATSVCTQEATGVLGASSTSW